MKSNQQNRTYKIILILFIILTYIATPICALFNLLTFTYISYICQAIAVFLFLLAFRTERIPADSGSEPLSITGEEQKHLADEQALRIRELRESNTEQSLTIERLQRELTDAQKALSIQTTACTHLEEQLAQSAPLDTPAGYADFLPPAKDTDETTIDILQIVQDTIRELEESALQANIRIQIASSSNSLYIKAAPSRIRILFRNIIDNSIKYMQRTGILLITISNIGSDIFIVLKDNGMGLDTSETNHIFELNFQGSNRISGNGLGLTQAKAIVDYYGGTIYAKSTQNQGMGIYIQLPTD